MKAELERKMAEARSEYDRKSQEVDTEYNANAKKIEAFRRLVAMNSLLAYAYKSSCPVKSVATDTAAVRGKGEELRKVNLGKTNELNNDTYTLSVFSS